MEVGLRPGMTLGRYVLDEHAASGGMGVVFKARQLGAHGFERTVAVKTIHPALVSDGSNRKRLIDEARIAAAIHHENVVEVLDVQDENGLLYLVLEWIDGVSVRALLRRCSAREESLPIPVAVRVVADMLDGLHHAHELTDAAGQPRELVHRDVSPDNAIIQRNGTTKLIDFGLARARDRLASVTESGAVLGKVSYMAPEQARGEKVDRRADLWAVGVVLRLCVTGALAHGATSDIQRLYMLSVGQEPDPLPPSVPAFLVPILTRALAVDAADRFPTAAAFRAALVEAAPHVATREEVAAVLAEPLRERAAAAVPAAAEASRTVTSAPHEPEPSLVAVSQSRVEAPRRSALALAAGLAAAAAIVGSALTVALMRTSPAPAPPPPAAPAAEPVVVAVTPEPVLPASAPTASVATPAPARPSPRPRPGGAKPTPSVRDYGF